MPTTPPHGIGGEPFGVFLKKIKLKVRRTVFAGIVKQQFGYGLV